MNNQLPGNLAEIFPLRLRLRKEFRFFQSGEEVIAERVEDSQRFSVRPWQYEMFLRFDGKRTFEETAKEVFQKEGGGFTAVGLLNFYRWLYQEDLVFCECDSVFELVGEEAEEVATSQDAPSNQPQSNPKLGRVRAIWNAVDDLLPGKPRMKQAIKVAAMIVFGLSILRLGIVAAPVFEPPVNRIYAKVEQFFYEDTPAPGETESTRGIADSPQKEVSLAGRAVSSEPAVPAKPVENPVVEIPEAPPGGSPEVGSDVDTTAISLEKMEDLRRRMSECRIRRDEFYIQNNEAGYRQEVEKMSALAKEIGEIESKL